MTPPRLYFILMTFFAMLFSASATYGGGFDEFQDLEIKEARPLYAPVVSTVDDLENPFSKKGSTDGSAHSTYLNASDAVPHASGTAISSATFAVVIALINKDENNEARRSPIPSPLSCLHKILFRAIISPNAP